MADTKSGADRFDRARYVPVVVSSLVVIKATSTQQFQSALLGDKTVPQFEIEWGPGDSVMIRYVDHDGAPHPSMPLPVILPFAQIKYIEVCERDRIGEYVKAMAKNRR